MFFLEQWITNCFALICFRGSEPAAEETVQLIRETGGVAVLAHPWALKNPAAIIRRLKDAGLHGIEAYRSDGKLSGRCSFRFGNAKLRCIVLSPNCFNFLVLVILILTCTFYLTTT